MADEDYDFETDSRNQDYEIELSSNTLDDCAIELGVYFFFLVILLMFFLDQVRGKIDQIDNWCLFRKLEILNESHSTKLQFLLKVMAIFYMVMPFITLLYWSLMLFYDRFKENKPLWAPICVLMVGIGMIILGYNTLRIKWTNFRAKTINVVCLIICILLITGYQFIIIFGYKHQEKFFPYSALFLNMNVTLVSILVYFSKYKDVQDIGYIVRKFFPLKGIELDRERDVNLVEEIDENQKDPNWHPSYEDLTDFITISKVSNDKFQVILGAGLVQEFNSRPVSFQRMVQLIVLGASTLPLIALSLILYLQDNKSKLGIITSFSVVLMDFFSFLIYQSDMVDTPVIVVILLIINRIMMVSLGQAYFIYGYMLLYIMYSIAFVLQIAKNRFPFEGDVVRQAATLKNFIQNVGNSAVNTKGMSEIEKSTYWRRTLSNPELLQLILTILYMGLMVTVSAVEIKGVTLMPAIIMAGTKYQKEYKYWEVALSSVFFVFSLFFLVGCYRQLVRKAKKMEVFNKHIQTSLFNRFHKYLSLMSFYLIFSWIASVVWSIIGFRATRLWEFITFGVFGSGFVLCFARAFVYFALNDFEYLQDVNKVNKGIDKHNKNIDLMEIKKAQIQQDLANGTLLLPKLPSAPQPTPVAPAEAKPQSTPPVEGYEDLDEEEAILAEQAAAEKNSAHEQAQADAQAADLAAQQQQIAEMIAEEQEKNRLAEEQRQQEMANNSELQAQEEQERREMEEQIRLEKEQQEEVNRKAAEEKRKRDQAAAEQIRKQEEARRKANQQKSKDVGQGNSEYNIAGKAQEVEIVSRKKGFKDDELYDGGEDEEQPQAPVASQDSGKLFIDMDKTMEQPGGMQKIASTRLKRVVDWRIKKIYWTKALINRSLRPNDLNFIYSLVGCFVFWLAMTITMMLTMEDKPTGLVYSIPFPYVTICGLIGSAVIYQSRTFNNKEIIYWGLINLAYLICGVIYFIYEFELKEMSVKNIGSTESSTSAYTQQRATNFFFIYILATPAFAHGLVILLRTIDRGFEKFDNKFMGIAGTFTIFIVLMLVSCFLFVNWKDGLAFMGVLIFLAYVAFNFGIYFKTGGFLPTLLRRINRFLMLCAILFTSVYSIFEEDLTTYMGIGLSGSISLFFLWFYAIFNFAKDFYEVAQRPVFYSGSLFPVYKFNPKKNDVEFHYTPLISWILGLIIIVLYGFYTNYSLKPRWFGAVMTIAIQLLILVSVMYLRSLTLDAAKNAMGFITPEVARSAWIQAKKIYAVTKSAYSRKDLFTYRRAWVKRYAIRQYINILEGKKVVKVPDSITPIVKEEITVQGDPKMFYKSIIKNIVNSDKYNLNDLADVSFLQYEAEQEVQETFLDEYECMINFVMIAIQNSRIRGDQINKGFLRFLTSKKDIFHALGIDFVVPSRGTLASRMEQVNSQIELLQPKQKTIFDQLKLMYEQEQLNGKSMSDQLAQEEKAAAEERAREAESKQLQKKEDLAKLQEMVKGGEVDINMDIDSMPDCRLKYDIIVKRAKANGQKFTDVQFPANDQSIGERLKGSLGFEFEWLRMSEHQTETGESHVSFDEGIDAGDIIQGNLGDCYFLSAIACLGTNQTRDKFIFLNTDDEFQECGAFCIKFYENGQEDIVIVDDFIPLINGSEWAFVQTSNKCKEVWPMMIEKAYAKKYGSYEKIARGFVSLALAELTNGIPEEMETAKNQNLEKWWAQLLDYHKQGVFMGAGSPSNPGGDSVKSEGGISQGHAFTILKIMEIDGVKLICLRNPWGFGEWNGDWADDSELWTTRMKNMTGQQEFKEDGIFWMDFNDFVEEFAKVYACRVYNEDSGWTNQLIDDEWKGKYAEGVPNKAYPKAKIEKNPQYGITISQAGKGYIVLRLNEKVSPSVAVQAGFLTIQANKGKPVSNLQSKSIPTLAMIRPSATVTQAAELTFPSNLSYPYTFSCVVANMNHGQEGEGKFSIQVFSKDQNMKIEKLN